MAATPEGKVKDMIKKWWRKQERAHYFMPAQNGRGVNGVSDFIGVVNTVFVAIEAKANGGAVTPLQQMFLDETNAAGGVAVVVRTEDDLRTVETMIEVILRRRT